MPHEIDEMLDRLYEAEAEATYQRLKQMWDDPLGFMKGRWHINVDNTRRQSEETSQEGS